MLQNVDVFPSLTFARVGGASAGRGKTLLRALIDNKHWPGMSATPQLKASKCEHLLIWTLPREHSDHVDLLPFSAGRLRSCSFGSEE
jgi:hypothetical protein